MLERLLDDMARVATARPGAPAFIGPDGSVVMTHGALARLVGERSGALATAGLGPGDAVAFGVRQGPDGIVWLLACLRAGIALVVLDPGVRPDLLAARCRSAATSAVLLDPLVASLSGTRSARRLARLGGIALPDPASLAPRILVTGPAIVRGAVRVDRLSGPAVTSAWEDEAPALVVFTSGSTGMPRGVVHTPRSIVASVTAVRDLGGITADARVLATALHIVVPALLAGGAAVVPPRRASKLDRTTRDRAITHLAMTPTRAVEWVAGGGVPAGLRGLFLGTAPVRNAALRRIVPGLPATARAWGIYGLTEMLLVAAVDVEERLAHDELHGDLVGRALPGASIVIAADDEIHVSGTGLAGRYLGGPAVTEIGTGDLGRLEGGRLILRGRRKEMLIRRGDNIYPALYEPALIERGRLADAALVGVPDEYGDERAVLWIVPRAGESAAMALSRVRRLVDSIESPFDAHARPDDVLAIADLPRSGRSGKVDRRALVLLGARRLGLRVSRDPILPETS